MLRSRLFAVLALSAAAFSSAFSVTLPARHTRVPSKVSTVACRLGDLSGDQSRRLDFKRGKFYETTPLGKQVCRDVSRHALSRYDDLDRELADVSELPNLYILEAEEEFRNLQGHGPANEASF